MWIIYLVTAIIGYVLPYYFFISFLSEFGFDLRLLLEQLLANHISIFFAVNMIVMAVTFLVFSFLVSRRFQKGNWWVYLMATLLVGPSFAIPLFLFFREPRFELVATSSLYNLFKVNCV